jgi:hypothetical protein
METMPKHTGQPAIQHMRRNHRSLQASSYLLTCHEYQHMNHNRFPLHVLPPSGAGLVPLGATAHAA